MKQSYLFGPGNTISTEGGEMLAVLPEDIVSDISNHTHGYPNDFMGTKRSKMICCDISLTNQESTHTHPCTYTHTRAHYRYRGY